MRRIKNRKSQKFYKQNFPKISWDCQETETPPSWWMLPWLCWPCCKTRYMPLAFPHFTSLCTFWMEMESFIPFEWGKLVPESCLEVLHLFSCLLGLWMLDKDIPRPVSSSVCKYLRAPGRSSVHVFMLELRSKCLLRSSVRFSLPNESLQRFCTCLAERCRPSEVASCSG